MITMQINVGDTSWLSLDNRDYVDTPIHVKCGNYVFPHEEWTDVTFPMLCEWAEMVIRNSNLNNQYSLYFHDGPYRMDILQKDDNSVNVRFINFRRREFCEYEQNFVLEDLIVAIYTAILDFNDLFWKNNEIIPNPSIYAQTKIYETKLAEFLAQKEA